MFTLIHNFGTIENAFIHDQSEQLKKAGQIFLFFLFFPPLSPNSKYFSFIFSISSF